MHGRRDRSGMREPEQTILMLGDPGRTTDRLIGPPMEIGNSCAWRSPYRPRWPAARTRTYWDIKPAHVLVSVSTSQVWLTGFGITSRLPRERQSPAPWFSKEHSPIAPEQTGRMNSSIDPEATSTRLGSRYIRCSRNFALHGF
jgi:hypothetical protein